MKTPLTCDATRNRLLVEPNPTRVPADLRGHVDDCSACKEFLVRFTELHRDLKALPAPDSEMTKVEFLDRLLSAGPIIRSIPAAASTSLIPWKSFWRGVSKPLATTAACVAVGLGIWSLMPAKRGATIETPMARHELLNKIVNHNAALAKATTSKARMETLTSLVNDLETETQRVATVASPVEITALAVMFEKVITDGLVKQVDDMNAFATEDRPALLKAVAAKLDLTANSVMQLAGTSPPLSQPALTRILNAARKGSGKLTDLANGTGA